MRQYFKDSSFYAKYASSMGVCDTGRESSFQCYDFEPSSATVKVGFQTSWMHSRRRPNCLGCRKEACYDRCCSCSVYGGAQIRIKDIHGLQCSFSPFSRKNIRTGPKLAANAAKYRQMEVLPHQTVSPPLSLQGVSPPPGGRSILEKISPQFVPQFSRGEDPFPPVRGVVLS